MYMYIYIYQSDLVRRDRSTRFTIKSGGERGKWREEGESRESRKRRRLQGTHTRSMLDPSNPLGSLAYYENLPPPTDR